MNLIELMKKHPDEKYKLGSWVLGEYICMDDLGDWRDENDRLMNPLVGVTFMDDSWQLFISTAGTITKDYTLKQVK